MRQLRIFAPPTPPYSGTPFWAETILGRCIAPLTQGTLLSRWWFSRYFATRGEDGGDCEIDRVPREFEWSGRGGVACLASVRFRYAVRDGDLATFESVALGHIAAEGLLTTGPLPYAFPGELGGGRFLGETDTAARQAERADRVLDVLHAVSRHVLHCVVGPDNAGRFRPEVSGDPQNPHGSVFESLHHLVCNITAVPTAVLVTDQGELVTHWMRPVGKVVRSIRLRF